MFTFSAIFLFGQSTINITTSGGSYTSERWTNVTTATAGGGTVVWSQGTNIGDNAGDINVDISLAPGSYFVNCYDTWGDGWNGGVISVTDYAGNVIGDNGGASPNNGTTGADDLEASFEIIVPAAPTCPAPTLLNVTNLTQTSADLGWTAGGTETAWNVQYGTAGFTPGTGTVVGVSTNPFSLTGLSDGVSYDFWVQAVCGSDSSVYAGPFTFTTLCYSVTTFPFVETFDSTSSTRGCWSNIQESGSANWTFNTGSSGGAIDTAASGTLNAVFVSANPSGGAIITKLVSPVMDLSSLSSPRVTFFYGQESWFGDQNELKLYYRDSPSGTWTEIWSDDQEVASWTQADATLPNPSATYQIAFEGINGWGRANVIDDIVVEEGPVCTAPTNLTVSNLTPNGADLSWTVMGTETVWNVQYDTAGFVPGTGTIVSVTTNPYTVSGLSEGTAYDFWVQADCGADSSSYAGPFMFTTPCNVKIAPYSEDLSGGVLPECWSQSVTFGSGWVFTGTPGFQAGSNGKTPGTYAWIDFSQSDTGAVLNVPDVDISGLTYPRLKFEYFQDFSTILNAFPGNAAPNILYVEYYDASGSWTMIDSIIASSASWLPYEYDLSSLTLAGTVVTVRFRAESGGDTYDHYGDILLDKVSIKEATIHDLGIIAAIAPSGCELTNAESIEVWVVNNGLVDETGFDVSYGVNGGSLTTENISSTLAVGDTLMHVFAGTADMSTNYTLYDVALNVSLSTDEDSTNNNLSTSGKNFITPGAPTTTADTVCNGDTAHVMAMSLEGEITWYDAMSGGNVVGEGDDLQVAPSATTTYYAETKIAYGFSDDFESYNMGDSIVQANPTNWATWPGGTPGGLYDAPISNAQAASGSNSLHLDNAASNIPDPVLPFYGFQHQTWTSGSFVFSMNMYIVTTAYFNLQGKATPGQVWAAEMNFSGVGGLTDPTIFSLNDSLTGNYPGINQWFNVMLKCEDLTTGTWELFIDSVSQGTATLPNGFSVGGCNLYAAAPATGPANNYYIDDISWEAVAADACTSLSRAGAEVVVNDCSNINELSFKDLNIYPNPNNGQFTIANSELISEVFITDLQGKTVYSNTNVNSQNLNIEMDYLERGMYMINIKTIDGMITKTVTLQ